MVLAGERLARDLLRRDHGQLRHLRPDLVDRTAGLLLDVAPGALEQLLARLARVDLRLILHLLGGPPRTRDDVVGLLACLAQPLAVLLEELVGLPAGPLGCLDRVLDRLPAAVERLLDPRVGEPAEDEHRQPEGDQCPDHHANAGRDEEVPAVGRGDDVGQPRHRPSPGRTR